jgi:hypothetical protein
MTLLKKVENRVFHGDHSGHCATFSQKLGFFSGLTNGHRRNRIFVPVQLPNRIEHG